MKITRVTPFLVGPKPSSDGWSNGQIVILVKLETDTGLIGWGEAYALDIRQRAICEIILALGEAVKQMAQATPRAFLHNIARPLESKHPGIDYASAVSAIEIALWDLLGKSLGQPVHALLGGALVDRIPVYANAWDFPTQPAEAVAERCARMRSEGYRAVKIYPLRRPKLADAEACLRLTREAVGPDTDIMLDFSVQTDPRHALRAAHLFEPYNPYWIEEPIAGDDLDAMAEFRANVKSRVTTGERQSGIRHYRNVVMKRAADVLNPDIAGAGGILEMLDIGAMANAHSVKISPHSWNSTTVAFLAMLHVCAVMPNSIYAELYYDYLELGNEFADCDYVIKDGYASLPLKPGLGIEMDEKALTSLAP
ncbi:MAG: mandelate racemase/muconate lactonizing enzyme family protein [Alphaproteobacteria bacterium]